MSTVTFPLTPQMRRTEVAELQDALTLLWFTIRDGDEDVLAAAHLQVGEYL